MNFLGNVVWFLLGGFVTSMMYFVAGFLMCITIIGIPFGLQLFKFGMFAFWPFGRHIEYTDNKGGLTTILNVIWILCGWWEIAVVHAVSGLILCITVIGIPFGVQHFKIAGLSLLPFGRTMG